MLHVNHLLLQFADITDPLLSTAALFSRFYSHMIQTWAIKAASYLVRWIMRYHMHCTIESSSSSILRFTRWCRNTFKVMWYAGVVAHCTKFSQDMTVKVFCKSDYICWSYDQKSSVFLTHTVDCNVARPNIRVFTAQHIYHSAVYDVEMSVTPTYCCI